MVSGQGFCFCDKGEVDWAVCMTRKSKRKMSNYKIRRTYRLLPQTPKKFVYVYNYFLNKKLLWISNKVVLKITWLSELLKNGFEITASFSEYWKIINTQTRITDPRTKKTGDRDSISEISFAATRQSLSQSLIMDCNPSNTLPDF